MNVNGRNSGILQVKKTNTFSSGWWHNATCATPLRRGLTGPYAALEVGGGIFQEKCNKNENFHTFWILFSGVRLGRGVLVLPPPFPVRVYILVHFLWSKMGVFYFVLTKISKFYRASAQTLLETYISWWQRAKNGNFFNFQGFYSTIHYSLMQA